MLADLRHNVVLKPQQLGVVKGRVYRGNEKVALSQNGYEHAGEPILAVGRPGHLEPQQLLGLLDTALEVPDRVHLAEVHSHRNEGLGDLR